MTKCIRDFRRYINIYQIPFLGGKDKQNMWELEGNRNKKQNRNKKVLEDWET